MTPTFNRRFRKAGVLLAAGVLVTALAACSG